MITLPPPIRGARSTPRISLLFPWFERPPHPQRYPQHPRTSADERGVPHEVSGEGYVASMSEVLGELATDLVEGLKGWTSGWLGRTSE